MFWRNACLTFLSSRRVFEHLAAEFSDRLLLLIGKDGAAAGAGRLDFL